jgi:hypothetical protein
LRRNTGLIRGTEREKGQVPASELSHAQRRNRAAR